MTTVHTFRDGRMLYSFRRIIRLCDLDLSQYFDHVNEIVGLYGQYALSRFELDYRYSDWNDYYCATCKVFVRNPVFDVRVVNIAQEVYDRYGEIENVE